MPHYYNRDGTPAPDVLTWAENFERLDRHVGDTTIGDSRVSTVFLGLDHQYIPGGPPLVFETMVFGGPLGDEMERYSTEEQAREGHDRMVARVRESTGALRGLP